MAVGLQVCLLDTLMPDQGAVTEVNVKYILDHPDPDQLEVYLSRERSDVNLALWEGGKLVKGSEFGEAIGLIDFGGTLAQDGWILSVRDVVPGDIGWLRGLTIRPFYAPIGPVPSQLSGTPGRPTSFRFPPGTPEYTAPDKAELETEIEEQDLLEETSGWQTIKGEPFEISFPTSGWTLSDGNGSPIYWWDDDNYRAHSGYRSAWPAKGGADALDPPGDPYPPNANSWMKYGPFDLSDAATAEVGFWLRRDTEPYWDPIYIGVSHDNITYNGSYWDGYADWEQITWNLDAYKGDASVWVAWAFYSDGSDQREGPWVDDALIRKYVPGQATIQGTITYANRNNEQVGASFTSVRLFEFDPGGADDPLGTTTTDANGFFQFPTRTNWDDDDTDPDPNNRRLDLYFVIEADYNDSASSWHRVTNFGNQTYTWQTSILYNVSDGSHSYHIPIPSGFSTLPAMWIFQDLRNSWEYVRNYTWPQFDPGSVTAKWQYGEDCYPSWPFCSSFFDGGIGGPFIFINHSQRISADTVVHETGHHYVYNATGWWLWDDPWCYNHDLFTQESIMCAWSEGWADFFPLAITAPADQCYDKGVGPCTGFEDQDHYNLESHGRGDGFPSGDTVEGRVAGALYDLFDYTNEPTYDSAYFGFDPIADIVFQEGYYAFHDFWNDWKSSGLNKHHAVRAIYQNTIDYDTSPRFSPLLPDRNVLEGYSYTHAIDLWSYTADDESADADLTYQLTSVTDTRCGISLVDGHWINIIPQAGWFGMCDATIRVSDSLKTASDTFRVTVMPIVGHMVLPLIMR